MSEKRVTKAEKEKIVRQYHSGKSVKQISAEYACSISSVYRWIREFPLDIHDNEVYECAYSPDDLGWMHAMIDMVQEQNKIVRIKSPFWLVS